MSRMGSRVTGKRQYFDVPVVNQEKHVRLDTGMISVPLVDYREILFNKIFNTYLRLCKENKYTDKTIEVRIYNKYNQDETLRKEVWTRGEKPVTELFNHSLFEKFSIFWLISPDRVVFNFQNYTGYLPLGLMEELIGLHEDNRYVYLDEICEAHHKWNRKFLTLRGTSYEF